MTYMDWTPKGLEFESQYRDDFSHFHVIQTCPGAHKASCSIGMGFLPMGTKGWGHEADHSSPSNAEEKNGGAIPPITHVFMA
jgi:hypothetical protein